MKAKQKRKSAPAAKRPRAAGKDTQKAAVLAGAKEAMAAVKKGAKPATVGALVAGRILEGKMTTEEIAKDAKRRLKGGTTPAVVYWHRAHMRGLGIQLPQR